MSEPSDTSPADPPPYEDSSAAPFVYFDIVPTHGIMNGAIQIEMASRVLVPKDGAVAIKFMGTCHLRCSPTAAGYLRDALIAALQMLEKPQDSPTAANKLN